MEHVIGDKLDRGIGSVLGACIGDAAGAILEFHHGEITKAQVRECFEFPGGGLHKTAPA